MLQVMNQFFSILYHWNFIFEILFNFEKRDRYFKEVNFTNFYRKLFKTFHE